MQTLRNIFDYYDRNHDGRLGRAEIEMMLPDLQKFDSGLEINDSTFSEWIHLVDKNPDNQISYNEFLSAISKHLHVSDANRKDLGHHFNSFDLNQNGKLNRVEFGKFIHTIYEYMNDSRFQYNETIADVFFRDIDVNRDGEISFDEFYLYINGVLRARR